MVFCFEMTYVQKKYSMCYVRWLVSAGRLGCMTANEARGPFAAYRWECHPGSRRWGHPVAGTPHYGVINADSVLYTAPMIASLATYSDAHPLFRLNTDMWDM